MTLNPCLDVSYEFLSLVADQKVHVDHTRFDPGGNGINVGRALKRLGLTATNYCLDEANIVTEAAFSGEGCAISQASADLLIESIIGKNITEIKEISKEDILDNLGIELGPVRLKCALLPLKVIKAGIYGIGELDQTD